jgi:acetylornithine deacetylase/succinyl-diaminopimelate desuccinylase-like protein
MDWEAHLNETVGLLRDLIRIDTTNPPGNEVKAAEFLGNLFTSEGIPAEVLTSEGTRGNIVARLKGRGAAEPLLMLGHLDVVPVELASWTVEPFAGIMKDGAIYGRGALDMKGMVAVEVATMLALKRQGTPLNRDVIFAAVADEEMGGAKGAGWLVENHWEKVKAGFVLNEGGGGLLKDGKKVFHCQTAEKGICWAKMRVRGSGGHASMPQVENPTVILSEAIARIGSHVFPPIKNAVTVESMERMEKAGLLPEGVSAAEVLTADEDVGRRLQSADHMTSAIIRNTATPTALKAGGKTNVIPQVAEVDIDIRAFPDTRPSDLIEEVRRIVDDPRVEIEITRDSRGSSSPIDTDFWRVIERTLREAEPDVVFLPYQSAGGTDSGYFRSKGAVCYGADPFFVTEQDWDGVHGNDERLPVAALEWGLKWIHEIVGEFCRAG